MTEYSYQDNVKRGFTGPNTTTCLMASFDRISEVAEIRTQTYEAYKDLREAYVDACTADIGNTFVPQDIVQRIRDVKRQYYAELGVPTPRNIVYTRADSEEELSHALGRLSAGGFRTCVYLDVGGLHGVGVEPAGTDRYLVKSTWSPFTEGEPVGMSSLFSLLDRAPRMRKREGNARKTMKESNITAIPPEPR